MIEYGTFGLTANYQDFQQTLNNGSVLSTINSITGNVNFLQENFEYLLIQSGNCTMFFDNINMLSQYGYIEVTTIGGGYRTQYGGGSFKFHYIDIVSAYTYGYVQYQATDIKIGSNIYNTNLGTYIHFDNSIAGIEMIYMYIGAGIIQYTTDEIRYISTTPGSLIQSTPHGAPAGFLTIRSATQQYKIRLYAP